MKETWLPVPGWGGYEVSDLGRVRSVDRVLPNGQFCAGKVLAQSPDSRGYMRVGLRRGGKSSSQRVHVLVMLAHKGPRPRDRPHILHKGDEKHRNDLTLRYGTQSENEREKRKKRDEKERKRKKTYRGRKGSPRGTSPGSLASPESQP